MLPSFACWCEQDQVATVLETCVMKVRRKSERLQLLATSNSTSLEGIDVLGLCRPNALLWAKCTSWR